MFQELERTVYNSLYTLVKDTSVLRDYTHAILTIFQVRSDWCQIRAQLHVLQLAASRSVRYPVQ